LARISQVFIFSYQQRLSRGYLLIHDNRDSRRSLRVSDDSRTQSRSPLSTQGIPRAHIDQSFSLSHVKVIANEEPRVMDTRFGFEIPTSSRKINRIIAPAVTSLLPAQTKFQGSPPPSRMWYRGMREFNSMRSIHCQSALARLAFYLYAYGSTKSKSHPADPSHEPQANMRLESYAKSFLEPRGRQCRTAFSCIVVPATVGVGESEGGRS
jgi:hypothetical protein